MKRLFPPYAAALALIGTLLFGGVSRAEEFPTRPMKIVLPFSAGTVSHATLLSFGQVLSELLKQPVVVLPQPGADGVLAAQTTLQAPADGYTTLFFGDFNAIAAVTAEKKGRELGYRLDEFEPVCGFMTFSQVVMVRRDSGLKTFADVVAFAKKHPGKLNVGTTSVGSTTELTARLLKMKTGLDFVVVPHNTLAELQTSIAQGLVDVAVQPFGAVRGLIESGAVIPIATSGKDRLPYLPEIPTIVETDGPGFKEVHIAVWAGMYVKKGTPPERIKFLEKKMLQALGDPRVAEVFKKQGINIALWPRSAVEKRMREEIARWRRDL